MQYINRTYRRSGALWEGRHKGSLVDAEDYLLRCYRYIELNPVTAGMVKIPDEYLWSSYRANALGEADSLTTPHSVYQSLGSTKKEQVEGYRALFGIAMMPTDISEIRHGIESNYPVGCARFKAQIEEALDRKLGTGRQGRPAKGGSAIDQ